MAKVKVLCRIGEFDEAYLPELKAVIEKAGGVFLRAKTVPDTEHWLEYHCRFRKRVKGLRRFARELVRFDLTEADQRKKENERRTKAQEELLPDTEPLPVAWPNEERRASAGAMLEEFLENNSSIRRDLEAPEGAYERDVALDKVRGLLARMKWELGKDFEDTEG
jgi:hypothetical protein